MKKKIRFTLSAPQAFTIFVLPTDFDKLFSLFKYTNKSSNKKNIYYMQTKLKMAKSDKKKIHLKGI